MLGFPLLYFKGMRLLMFQLSGFYYSSELHEHMSSLAGRERTAGEP